MDLEAARNRMVAQLDPELDATAAALRAVPRHRFVPEAWRDLAYADRPLPIGDGQTISAPSVVAEMCDHLALEAGDRTLEIGTGSGYHTAVTAEIVASRTSTRSRRTTPSPRRLASDSTTSAPRRYRSASATDARAGRNAPPSTRCI